MAEAKNKVCLICIDGWGHSEKKTGNACLDAKTPIMDSFEKDFLHCKIKAHGLDVGLPEGIMGNSEVGHLTIGGGRIQYQDLVRINLSIKNGTYKENKSLLEAFEKAKQGNGRVHFLGLVSDGGVHSHIDHFKTFIAFAKEQGVPQSFVHYFADGRDTPPDSGIKYMKEIGEFFDAQEYGSLATVTGRYYAMDRDKRWDRVETAYNGIVHGKGEKVSADKLVEYVQSRYAVKETDEFLTPIIVNEEGLVKDNDVLIFMDFRADRMREIVEVFGIKPPFLDDDDDDDDDEKSKDNGHPKGLHVLQMTQYSASFPLPVVYQPQSMGNGIAEWLSNHKIRQFHTAETEKYAHVTFFFNGGVEKAFNGEERGLVPSPKVATYDLCPEMSVAAVADSVVDALKKAGTEKEFPFVMCNMAPPDMVGHTGDMARAVEAVEATDKAIGEILDACQKYGYVLMVTSDHGNAEEMLLADGSPKTSHSSNLVPFNIACDSSLNLSWSRTEGGLCDVAPSILAVMGLDQPKEMTGSSMLKLE